MWNGTLFQNLHQAISQNKYCKDDDDARTTDY